MNQPWHNMSALALGRDIGTGVIDPVDLCTHFLERIKDVGSDSSIYLKVLPERARAEATAARDRARSGLRRGPMDGVPVSWKDLFDTAGDTTTAASPILRRRKPARTDAEVVRRATRAGLVCLGKTNLTELAFSGLGINPATGTPANPFDESCARAPGGSSSGAAVSLVRGLAAAALGSDTGGSVRIPAAWNGLVGLKTTNGLLPMDGMLPLAPSLDSIGTITRDVADANALLAVLSDGKPADLTGTNLQRRRLVIADGALWRDLDPDVEETVREAIGKLAALGADVVVETVDEFSEALALVGEHGPFVAVEGYAVWRDTINTDPNRVYRHVRDRFRAAKKISSYDAGRLRFGMADIARRLHARMAGWDAILAPTVAISAPALAPLVDEPERYIKANLKALRNTTLGNVLGVTALTLPCGMDTKGLPTGLMLMARPNQEAALLRLGLAVERALEGG